MSLVTVTQPLPMLLPVNRNRKQNKSNVNALARNDSSSQENKTTEWKQFINGKHPFESEPCNFVEFSVNTKMKSILRVYIYMKYEICSCRHVKDKKIIHTQMMTFDRMKVKV